MIVVPSPQYPSLAVCLPQSPGLQQARQKEQSHLSLLNVTSMLMRARGAASLGPGEGVHEAETTEYKIKLNYNEGLRFDLLCTARERKIFHVGVPVSSFLLGCRSRKERGSFGR